MKLRVAHEAVITVTRISNDTVDLRIRMLDKVITRTMRRGDEYRNEVKLELNMPSEAGTSYEWEA